MGAGPAQPTPLDQAMRWLARREYSVRELESRLARKGYAPDEIVATLDSLQSRGLVSDQRFAESLTRSRIERGYGPVKIAHELRAKGVDDSLVEAVLDGDSDTWVERLRSVWAKRFGNPPDCYQEWARQARGLQSRGFTAEQVRRVLPDIDS